MHAEIMRGLKQSSRNTHKPRKPVRHVSRTAAGSVTRKNAHHWHDAYWEVWTGRGLKVTLSTARHVTFKPRQSPKPALQRGSHLFKNGCMKNSEWNCSIPFVYSQRSLVLAPIALILFKLFLSVFSNFCFFVLPLISFSTVSAWISVRFPCNQFLLYELRKQECLWGWVEQWDKQVCEKEMHVMMNHCIDWTGTYDVQI